MSLYVSMLGEAGAPLGRLLEGMMTSQVATVLARLAVADELAGGPLTAGELAARVAAAPDALSRLLAAAAVYGLVRKDDAGRYALTPAGDLLRTDAEGSARGVAVGFLGPPHWQSAGLLEEVVRSPDPVDPTRPDGIYAYYGRHPGGGGLVRPGHGPGHRDHGGPAHRGPVPAAGFRAASSTWAAAAGRCWPTCSAPCRTPAGC